MDSGDRRGGDDGGSGDRVRDVAPLRPLSVVQGVSRYCGDVLDGRNALPSPAFRLSLRSGEGLTPVRNVQGDGTAAVERDCQSRHGSQLGAWAVDSLRWRLDFGALAAFEVVAGCSLVGRPRPVGALDRRLCG